MMEEIIAKVDRDLIKKELNDKTYLRETNKGGNQIYVFTHHNSPNMMQEVGRLREISFRNAGGGTGKAADIDKYDLQENPYRQLIVWDPEAEEILGGYRYMLGEDIPRDKDGNVLIATARLFNYSEKFIAEYLPYTIELGRSFVQPDYQTSKAGAKALFALDNLWDGLGALCVDHPEIKYFFGKVTMYPHFNSEARDLILSFMQKHFPDPEDLIKPFKPLQTELTEDQTDSLFSSGSYKEDYKILNAEVRKRGVNIPPLVNAYMNLSPTMKTFGTAINDVFGDVEETGIMITIADIFDDKKKRYIESYIQNSDSKANIEFK
ncbi:GNAT family N-acetyltransferase [Saccharicrinis sp. FJH54]|uniref:GNAT family N-acetyltransferase n=1 Tax=Saccharicrinis sp. FJH54 TaxID=3344665 RepID=UPI0035D4E8F9